MIKMYNINNIIRFDHQKCLFQLIMENLKQKQQGKFICRITGKKLEKYCLFSFHVARP